MDKTKVMILGSQIYTSRLDLSTIPKVTVNGPELPNEVEVKSPGMHYPDPQLGPACQPVFAEDIRRIIHPEVL